MDFRKIIAEPPYDQMGEEFAEIFGSLLNATEVSMNTNMDVLATQLFLNRLNLAKKYGTFFASQVKDTWQDRWNGQNKNTCYSFAMPDLVRTFRFFKWCEEVKTEKNGFTNDWHNGFYPEPELPFKPHPVCRNGWVWEHAYKDHKFSRIQYSPRVWLFTHPTGNQVVVLREEAKAQWKRALTPNATLRVRLEALATFEWLWFWTNPFGRSGALTGDALSLLVQKKLQVHVRPGFYHQDCEALLLPFEEYKAKRVEDMTTGFVPRFVM